MSHFRDLALRAERFRMRPRRVQPQAPSPSPARSYEWKPEQRPYQVVTVASNKGGVGKTTIATNLAVYLRALREELPILIVGLDDQPMIDQMFGLESDTPEQTVKGALRRGSFDPAIRLGQYGVHYVPGSPEIGELKQEIRSVERLRETLDATEWNGLVIIDTKSDLEILTRNAIAASDLTLVVVKDHASVLEAQKIFDFADSWNRPRSRTRVVLSQVDLRIKYREGQASDILALLISEIRERGFPLFETFLSSSPKIESLSTNPEERAHSILHGALNSVVHGQMLHLAQDVLAYLTDDSALAAGFEPAPLAAAPLEPAPLEPVPLEPARYGGEQPPLFEDSDEYDDFEDFLYSG